MSLIWMKGTKYSNLKEAFERRLSGRTAGDHTALFRLLTLLTFHRLSSLCRDCNHGPWEAVLAMC